MCREKTNDNIKYFRIGGTDITCGYNVSLLGIIINFMHKSCLVKNLPSVFNTVNCLEAFLHMSATWSSQTNTELLHVKRLKLMALVNKLSPEYIDDLVNLKSSSYNFRGERKAKIPRVNTLRYGLRSFRSEVMRDFVLSHSDNNQADVV